MQKLDEAKGVKVIIEYRNEPAYLSIFPEAKELFISSVKEKDLKTIAGVNCLTRMISLAWQHAGTDKVMAQLERSRMTQKDLPTILWAELKKVI